MVVTNACSYYSTMFKNKNKSFTFQGKVDVKDKASRDQWRKHFIVKNICFEVLRLDNFKF